MPGGFSDNEDGAASARSAPPPLPCLFRNNSDKQQPDERPEIQWQTRADEGRTRKAAHALAANVEHFVETYGLQNVGFFTVTFDREVKDPKEAQRRMNNFNRRVLAELFGDRIRVLETHADGRPHYHLLVDCRGDIRTGFNWDHYRAVREWNNWGRRQGLPRPQGNLGRTDHLTTLHEALRAAGPRYGIGRMELTPVKTCSEAIGKYVGGYLSKGSIWRDARYKGARSVAYSKSFSRKVKGAFSWVEHGRRWREAVAAWAREHGCADLAAIKAVFGPRWAYHYGDTIAKIYMQEQKPVEVPDWAVEDSQADVTQEPGAARVWSAGSAKSAPSVLSERLYEQMAKARFVDGPENPPARVRSSDPLYSERMARRAEKRGF